jgi:hypothetical protein
MRLARSWANSRTSEFSGGRKGEKLSFDSRRVNPVNANYVEVDMKIGGRPKSLHKRNGATLSLVDAVILSHAAIQAEENSDENRQNRSDHFRVVGRTVAQGEGQGENPLACRNMGKHPVHQVCRRIRHAPSATGRADGSAFARQG